MRPAFYALSPGAWRDYVTLLHLPYTAWHVSYVVIGGCLAPTVVWGRLGAVVTAFALAVGVGAHALDELHGGPLGTRISRGALIGLAAGSILAACGIGIAGALRFEPWLLVLVPVGLFLVLAYNLELLGGRFHTDLWFALGWGGFPVICGYAACAGRIGASAVVAAGFAVALSLAQHALSAHVKRIRRDAARVEGVVELRSGARVPLDAAALIAAPERALELLAGATVLLALALVVARLA